ncbi:hypothetical protein [Bacillus sp. 2205SS5-2]
MKKTNNKLHLREEYGVETGDINAIKHYEITSKENASKQEDTKKKR